jgi:hypothetical protein
MAIAPSDVRVAPGVWLLIEGQAKLEIVEGFVSTVSASSAQIGLSVSGRVCNLSLAYIWQPMAARPLAFSCESVALVCLNGPAPQNIKQTRLMLMCVVIALGAWLCELTEH